VNDSDTEGSQRESQLSWNTFADLWNNPTHFTRAYWGGTEPVNLAPPAAPTNVQATSTPTSVTLTWDAVPGATGYRVLRDTKASGALTAYIKNTRTTPITALTLTDTSAVAGTTYRYAVVATNLVGDSPQSQILFVNPGSGGGGGCKGDANGSGGVDVSDAVAILQHVVGSVPLTGANLTNANVTTGDTSVDVSDAVGILQTIVGIDNGLGIKLGCG
jgi:hypothetical protein